MGGPAEATEAPNEPAGRGRSLRGETRGSPDPGGAGREERSGRSGQPEAVARRLGRAGAVSQAEPTGGVGAPGAPPSTWAAFSAACAGVGGATLRCCCGAGKLALPNSSRMARFVSK